MNARPVILATHAMQSEPKRMLEALGELRIAPALDPASLVAAAREAAIIIVRAHLPPDIFGQASRLRAAIRQGAGLDMIPLPEASAAGVLAANVPAVNARTVAEHVIMVTLMLLRQFRPIEAGLRAGLWQPVRNRAERSGDLSGRRLGIIGYGAIGQALAAIAMHGFGMRVSAFRRSDAPFEPGVGRASIDEICASCDIVVLACPLTDETRGLMDRRRIALMGKEALLINVSRGAVVDEAALIEALQAKALAGAALDVFEVQPLPMESPLRALDNVVLTPHLAGMTGDSMTRLGVRAAEQAAQVLAGALPDHLVNPEAVARYREKWG
jgi:D-3-phosphoglycerate dehydrogenase / 2-oxoglutarate reductase